jgi:acyl carrier protein
MDRAQVITAIEAALAEVLERELGPVSEQTRLFEDLYLDSTSVLQLLLALEDAIDLEIDPEYLAIDDFKTVGSLADHVLAQAASRSGA